jgi:hypothetical protein
MKNKQVIGIEVILCYPDFIEPFYLYTDAPDHQSRAVIMQDKNPIAFHSENLINIKALYTP